MEDVDSLFVFEGVEYVKKEVHDVVVAENNRYRDALTSIKRKASEPLAARGSVAARLGEQSADTSRADRRQQASDSSEWTLQKVSGPGYRSDGTGTGPVQVYRIDTGDSSSTGGGSTQAAAASDAAAHPVGAVNSSASTRFLYRPRDAVDLLAKHDLWQAAMLRRIEDKVDNVINKKKIDTIQDAEHVKAMIHHCMQTTKKHRKAIKGFNQYTVRLLTFQSLVDLYLMLLRDIRPRSARRRGASRPAPDAVTDDEASEDDEDAAAAADEDDDGHEPQENVVEEATLRRDVEAAFSWMIAPTTTVVAAEQWAVPMA